ncbi:MAG: cell division protein SepF [Candidatus Hodarchaeales archaeon]
MFKKNRKHLIRCVVINDLEETAHIQSDLIAGNIVIFSIKKLKMMDSMSTKRFIQRLKAIALEHESNIGIIGPDLFLCSPKQTHDLLLNSNY